MAVYFVIYAIRRDLTERPQNRSLSTVAACSNEPIQQKPADWRALLGGDVGARTLDLCDVNTAL